MTVTRQTRKPTGKPSWPIGLLTGAEKSGKTYSAAKASASDLVGRTFWIGVGEDDPDEYGAIEGADFDIVEHDGTYRDILNAVGWASAQPREGDKPNLIVLDSATRLWDLLCDDLQTEANERARRKAQKYNRRISDEDQSISMDLWNLGKQRWGHVMDALRRHDGPVLLTARLDVVTVVNDNGDPTKDKTTKVKAEKSLPFDVGFIVEFSDPGTGVITGVRSLKVRSDARTPVKDFTVDRLWRDLGLADDVGQRTHSRIKGDASADELFAAVKDADSIDALRAAWSEANRLGLLDATNDDGEPLARVIEVKHTVMREFAQPEAEEVPA